MKRYLLAVLALAALCFASRPVLAEETEKQHDARMDWFRDARFGMFIHWGLYSIPAGEWNGQTNHAEWIRHTAKIPIEEYDKLLPQFNPTNFNATTWARLAKHAGMKYLVITSKHHDGFCLWDSKLTDFDVMSTPFKRDILKELRNACQREGIRFCTYHSIMDWHNPDYLPRRDWERSTRSAEGADFNRYISYLRGQLRELVKGYHPGILWFDGEWENTWTHEAGAATYEYMLRLDPEIIVNNRVDKGRKGMQGFNKGSEFKGDYGTPEQEIPATGIPGTDWESCMTMNNHWGWNKSDNAWKSTEDLIRKLIDIASKGGNFLLNVGPRPDGTFPEQSVERLEGIGKWMRVNSESIYETEASPFKALPWGRCTQKNFRNSTTLYLHVFDWPANGQLLVPGLTNSTAQARLLASKAPLTVGYSPEGMTISVPESAPDPISSTIVLKLPGRPLLSDADAVITQDKDGLIELPAVLGHLDGQGIKFEGGKKNCIGYWMNPQDSVSWDFTVSKPGKYQLSADYATLGATRVSVIAGEQPVELQVLPTGDYSDFRTSEEVTFLLPAGKQRLQLKAVPDGWKPVNFRVLRLKPAA